MSRNGDSQIYGLYRGDDFVDVGTVAEIAERQGIKPTSVQFLAKPSYLNRLKERNAECALIAFKLEEDIEKARG